MATLYKRHGVWHVNYTDPNGRRLRRSLWIANEKLARIKFAEIEKNLELGKVGMEEAIQRPVAERLDAYLEQVRINNKPKTYTRYQQFARHILNFFADKTRITSRMVEQYKEHRLKEGAKSRTVNHEITFLKTAFGANGTHPFKDVKPLAVRDSKEIRWLTGAEVVRLQTTLSLVPVDSEQA